MSFQVHRDDTGLWVVTAPSGQVFGVAPTRDEAVAAVKHLGRVIALPKRGVRAVQVPVMTGEMRTRLELMRRERRDRLVERAKRNDKALAAYLNGRKRRKAA